MNHLLKVDIDKQETKEKERQIKNKGKIKQNKLNQITKLTNN